MGLNDCHGHLSPSEVLPPSRRPPDPSFSFILPTSSCASSPCCQVVPCLVLAFFAHPKTNHWFVFKVSACSVARPHTLLQSQRFGLNGLKSAPALASCSWLQCGRSRLLCKHQDLPRQCLQLRLHLLLDLARPSHAQPGLSQSVLAPPVLTPSSVLSLLAFVRRSCGPSASTWSLSLSSLSCG